jgi:hypothetical protein
MHETISHLPKVFLADCSFAGWVMGIRRRWSEGGAAQAAFGG